MNMLLTAHLTRMYLAVQNVPQRVALEVYGGFSPPGHYLVPMETLAPLTMLDNWRHCGWGSGGRCSLLASVGGGHLGVCEPGTRGRKGRGHAGHAWESVTSFSCSWKTLMTSLVLEVMLITSAIPTAWRSGKQSPNYFIQ